MIPTAPSSSARSSTRRGQTSFPRSPLYTEPCFSEIDFGQIQVAPKNGLLASVSHLADPETQTVLEQTLANQRASQPTNQPTNRQTDRRTDRPTNKQASKQTSKQANKQTSKQANKQTSKQTNKQTKNTGYDHCYIFTNPVVAFMSIPNSLRVGHPLSLYFELTLGQSCVKGKPCRSAAHVHWRGSLARAKWVWLKIKQQGLRRFWAMFPLIRVPFWYRFFEPQPSRKATLHLFV